MKQVLLPFLLSFLFVSGFSQSGADYYDWMIHGKIKKEKLNEAKLMFDIIPNFPQNYYSKLIDYVSVEISVCNGGKNLTAISKNEVLTPEQKNILNNADFGTDINVSIKFSYKDPANDAYGGGGKIKEIKPLGVTVVPETEAEFPGGNNSALQYFRNILITNNSDSATIQKINFTKLDITVNEAGEITNAKIFRSSGDQNIDKLFLEAARNMPRWKPAQDAKGTKVKQEIKISLKNTGC